MSGARRAEGAGGGRQPTSRTVSRAHPSWTGAQTVCLSCLNRFRAQYVEDALEAQKGELSALEADVIRSLAEHDVVSRDTGLQYEAQLTPGERIADRVAEFGGSWRFILIFAGVLFGWIALNSLVLLHRRLPGRRSGVHRVRRVADPLDAQRHRVAGPEEPPPRHAHPRRRAGQDEVAGPEPVGDQRARPRVAAAW